jgi:hypothetical protein
LGRTAIEAQTMVERPSIFFHKKSKIYFTAYFQPISLDSQQSLAIQFQIGRTNPHTGTKDKKPKQKLAPYF